MIKINLAPDEIQSEESKNDLLIVGVFLGAMILLGVCGVYVNAVMAEKKVDSRLAIAKKHLKKYQDINRKVEDLRSSKILLEKRKGVIENLIANRVLYSVFMYDFVSLLPDRVWLQSVRTKYTSDSGFSIDARAKSFSAFFIADWITALEGFPGITFDELGAISMTKHKDKDAKIYSFNIRLSYRKQ